MSGGGGGRRGRAPRRPPRRPFFPRRRGWGPADDSVAFEKKTGAPTARCKPLRNYIRKVPMMGFNETGVAY